MRWIGVDPGAARVGIAISDEQERLAVPLEVVPASAALPAIRAVAAREGAGGIVVGLPLTLAGAEGEAARAARRLGTRLARLGLPVEYADERLTTWAAEEAVREAAPSRAGRRPGRGSERPADDLAAAMLLQRFLDARGRARGDADRDAGGGQPERRASEDGEHDARA